MGTEVRVSSVKRNEHCVGNCHTAGEGGREGGVVYLMSHRAATPRSVQWSGFCVVRSSRNVM